MLHSPARQVPSRSPLNTRKHSDYAPYPPAKRAKTASTLSQGQIPHFGSSSYATSGRKKTQNWLDKADTEAHVPKADPSPLRPPNPVAPGRGVSGSIVPAHGPDLSIPDKQAPIGPTAPTASLLAQIDAKNAKEDRCGSSDDFRSVIDDLTIQNQKLKKKLRQYERLHCAHLQKEKLFEVRIHGLPPQKKHKLEQTLKSFASSIDDDETPLQRGASKLQKSTTVGSSALRNPASSSTSDSRPVDSAYASMSSIPNSQSQFQHNSTSSRQNHVKSYLNDIPETLAPKKVFAMSDNAKSKLVVRRLEQIFTGRCDASKDQPQSQQQQEVSTAAAEADRSKIEACGQRVWREGTREATILPENAILKVDSVDDSNAPSKRSRDSNDGSDSQSRDPEVNRKGNFEQRPTRPLDLDIHRAQVPSDNIKYIRHLGLASSANDKIIVSDGDEGWVYLNLLTGMAQLHTLNVTPEFIRKSIKERSQKFELSPDGSKVKWRGGNDGSRLSSSDGDHEGRRKSFSGQPSEKLGFSEDVSSREDANYAVETSGGGDTGPDQATGTKRRLVHIESDTSDRFRYEPLFVRPLPSDEEDPSEFDSDTPVSTNSMEWATGIGSSSNAINERQRHLRGRKHDNGHMIFYHRAKFCTDLGGNPDCTNDAITYDRISDQPLGCVPPVSASDPAQKEDTGRLLSDQMEVEASPSPLIRSALDLEDLKMSISDCASQAASISPMNMEASGLGGIHPTDNFVVRVQTRQSPKSAHSSSSASSLSKARKNAPHRLLHRISQSTLNAFHSDISKTIPRSHAAPKKEPVHGVRREIVSAVKTTLAPSALPPPSYGLDATSSDSDTESTTSQDDSSSSNPSHLHPSHTQHPRRSHNVRPPPHLRRSGIGFNSSADTETKESSFDINVDDAGDDDDDSDSIDLLAHARMENPEAVKAQEMEWESIEQDDHDNEKDTGKAKSGSVSMAATPGESGSDGSDSKEEEDEDKDAEDEEDDEASDDENKAEVSAKGAPSGPVTRGRKLDRSAIPTPKA